MCQIGCGDTVCWASSTLSSIVGHCGATREVGLVVRSAIVFWKVVCRESLMTYAWACCEPAIHAILQSLHGKDASRSRCRSTSVKNEGEFSKLTSVGARVNARGMMSIFQNGIRQLAGRCCVR